MGQLRPRFYTLRTDGIVVGFLVVGKATHEVMSKQEARDMMSRSNHHLNDEDQKRLRSEINDSQLPEKAHHWQESGARRHVND